MAKEEVSRGTRKRFQTTITDLAGNPQNPDTCDVRLEKVGVYTYGSPSRWYPCSNVGSLGEWGADIFLENYLTLGDWIARFRWYIAGVVDYDVFEFTLIRKDKPWQHHAGPPVN